MKPNAILCVLLLAGTPSFAEEAVTISTKIPGGNLLVKKNEGKVVECTPDLRGGRDWFYWCFEAIALRPGEVIFTFPEKVAGAKDGAVGHQGPAISIDNGKSWKWMGNATAVIRGRSFSYDFKQAGEKVRFAVSIPYFQSDFEAFQERNAKNPHLAVSELTTSLKGRKVELVQIGKPGPGVTPVLMTCRHHCCETIASHLLEGLMQTAISDSPAGEEFRKKYVLYVVPFVDKDGVEEGDQGKWRKPHDHNRDYEENSIFPEVKAIKALAEAREIQAAMDWHCPTLVAADHQVMYFAGPLDVPAHNNDAVKQFAAKIKKEMPKGAPSGPLVWLKKADLDRAAHFSGYFSKRKGILMSATLETPFAPPSAVMDPETLRSYGAAILRAWNGMEFKE